MIFNRRWLAVAAAVAFSGLSVFVICAAAPTQSRSGDLDFLELGKPYLVHFPEKSKLFSATTSGVSTTTFVTEDGEKLPGGPVTWSATLTNTGFRVIRITKGSWALLEHPESVEDAVAWMEHLRPKSQGEGNSARSKAKIRTVQTWVNLDHAIAISPLPELAADDGNADGPTRGK